MKTEKADLDIKMNKTEQLESMGSLEDIINSRPIPLLRKSCLLILTEWAATDTQVRKTAKRVLSEQEVEGDSSAVPMIEDIVELLVKKIEELEETPPGL